MSDWLPSPLAICTFLLTYLVHSTILIFLVRCAQQAGERWGAYWSQPRWSVVLGKSALVVPILTTVGVTSGYLPHLGPAWSLQSEGPVSTTQWSAPSVEEAEDEAEFYAQWARGEQAAEVSAAFADRAVAQAGRSGMQSVALASPVYCKILATCWMGFGALGLGLVLLQWLELWRARRMSLPVKSLRWVQLMQLNRRRLGVRRSVAMLHSAELLGPLTAGVARPFILLPSRLVGGSHGESDDDCEPLDEERDAIVAHEMAHIARFDAAWNLFAELVCRLFCIQPLNRLVTERLKRDMDFVADEIAVATSGHQAALARCLMRLGEELATAGLARQSAVALTSGMVAFHSTLGRRVELLLKRDGSRLATCPPGRGAMCVLLVFSLIIGSAIPRVVSQASLVPDSPLQRIDEMKRHLFSLAIAIGLTSPGGADEGPQGAKPAPQVAAAELKSTPDKLPDGIQDFNGMLIGQLAAKDVEKGTFVVQVQAVPRVWRNSEAKAPKSIVGKSVEVHGVFGKFLDVLVVMKRGETIEFEARHDGGDHLTFPGEMLRKVAPYDPADYPELPEEFRGFEGVLRAEIVKKDPETFELIVEIKKVLDSWEGSRAKDPQSIVGRSAMLAGFWNRQEEYHEFKVGQVIESGARHIGRQSEHLNVAEFVRPAESQQSSREQRMQREDSPVMEEGGKMGRGFRGVLVGRLLEKDVERGTFAIEVDVVPRVWNNNQSKNPKGLVGQQIELGGVHGRMLDALVVARVGDTLEVGALHDGGDQLRVGEMLRKVAPVQPGDYPELPDGFRGFKGMLIAEVVKKDDQHLDVIVEVKAVEKVFEGSTARQPESIVGERATLAGFWRRQEVFQSLRVGDKIRCGVEHPQRLSDHLTVFETVEKQND